ncbi:MAG: ATP-dependent helicase HrpB [Bryobacterales bacterium]|nr:ATP-dependent helicase HrpB [Bryobacterales bacterium]
MLKLPVDPLIPAVVEQLRQSANLILEAQPGAGKTTRVPPALLGFGRVLVLEPRRLAARLAARRVAAELGSKVGERVGYRVRFENFASDATDLTFVTEGVLARQLMDDPNLSGVSTVVFDEFHERHLEGDLALALVRRLQRTTRPDLRIVVLSATLDADPVAGFLGGCPVLRSEGRLFPLDLRYTPHSASSLEDRVAEALDRLVSEGIDGDVLVFLPGAAEIRKAMRASDFILRKARLAGVPLHGDLPAEDQDCAVQPGKRPKVIFSTNVAESSVTIEGVRAVIDSGLARQASDSPWTGLPELKIARISRSSAVQRAGRAGRTGPGRVVRLYTEEDFLRRPEFDRPQIQCRELSQVLLSLRAMGITDLHWFEAPPERSVAAAEQLLRRLGAVDPNGRLTPVGRTMASYPLHPRLARLVVEAERREAGEAGCAIAAVLSGGERLGEQQLERNGPSDLLLLQDSPWQPGTLKIFDQLRRTIRPRTRGRKSDEALMLATLTAFPDRVARRRNGEELLLAGGGSAVLSRSSVVRKHALLVAVEIEERGERSPPLVRLASGIEAEWLLDLFPGRLTVRTRVEWNRAAERVETVSAVMFDQLVIEESHSGATDPEQASELLALKAVEAGVEKLFDRGPVDAFLARLAFASQHSGLPSPAGTDIDNAIRSLCRGLRSFAELRQSGNRGGLLRELEARLPAGTRTKLEQVAPERLRLPSGRTAQIHYSASQPPWVASRLQDFFGLRETPRVAGGKVPLVVHLLAPNQRPVQMTTDLAGFWERLYPQIRKELSRLYPKHAWPEKP